MPPRYPDLTSTDFSLGVFVKYKMYEARYKVFEEIMVEITDHVNICT